MADKQLGAGMFQVNDEDEIHAFNRQWVIFSVALLANMVDRLVGLLGPVAKRQIYEAGFSSGKIAGDRMREFFGGGIEQIKKHLDLIKNMGWGRIKNVEYDDASGKIVIDFHETWESAGYGEVHPGEKQKAATCVLCAGLYAGAATGAFEKQYEAEETLCVSKGDPVCRFEFTPVGELKRVIK
ncbi:MAG: 4-vinyl reductase [Deltaproteobacteria bacterium]|nr:4-vinyl reductase [Candidatus Zymogenaceae bacterium]